MRGAERHAGLGHPGVACLARRERDAEVGDQRPAVVEQDVLGLDVAMDHAVAVRVIECTGHLGSDADRVGNGKLVFPTDPVADRHALDVGHDIKDEAIGLAAVEEREDMGMLQIGRRLDLR